MCEENLRVLSIQSTVVFGYVGNKSATFPLQVMGFDVCPINSVQFSNHKGYGNCKGQVLTSNDVQDLYDGLQQNNLLQFSHVLTGYIGSKCFLTKVGEIIREIRKQNPGLVYVCDPVMGDNGKMYVPSELLPAYKDVILPIADIITPNQYELELLTDKCVSTVESAIEAINILHEIGISTIVLSSSNLGGQGQLVCIASTKKGDQNESYKIEFPLLPAFFSGTGDLFTATFMAWIQKDQNLKSALEKTVSSVQAVLKRTLEYAQKLSGSNTPTKQQVELRLIQSKSDLENPKILFKASPL